MLFPGVLHALYMVKHGTSIPGCIWLYTLDLRLIPCSSYLGLIWLNYVLFIVNYIYYCFLAVSLFISNQLPEVLEFFRTTRPYWRRNGSDKPRHERCRKKSWRSWKMLWPLCPAMETVRKSVKICIWLSFTYHSSIHKLPHFFVCFKNFI